jgi:hypothetical protein
MMDMKHTWDKFGYLCCPICGAGISRFYAPANSKETDYLFCAIPTCSAHNVDTKWEIPVVDLVEIKK